jgi:hypothetical protein
VGFIDYYIRETRAFSEPLELVSESTPLKAFRCQQGQERVLNSPQGELWRSAINALATRMSGDHPVNANVTESIFLVVNKFFKWRNGDGKSGRAKCCNPIN